MENKSDILIVGSGVAGLSLALQLAKIQPDLTVTILAKSTLQQCNTNYAQGGIATVTNTKTDSFRAHIEDTIASGDGLSNYGTVKLIVETAPARIHELEEMGMPFSRNDDGSFHLGLEGGHSQPRVVHANDNTGEHLLATLIATVKKQSNIHCLENKIVFHLLQDSSKRVVGVKYFDTETKKFTHYLAKITILATGGSGQVYQNTTNPEVATGDGITLAKEVGAKTHFLNFFQFHPTVLQEHSGNRSLLLTEAIRGFGGYIVNKKGNRFLFQYDKRGELATRDIVSIAIFDELKNSGEDCVFLDCRHLDTKTFKNHFPFICKKLEEKGYDITQQQIPIVPAAHYQCGGISVDQAGRTTIENLYAIGECSETGLHGKNRLASNSLLEGLVFGHEAAQRITSEINSIEITRETIYAETIYSNENDAIYSEISATVKRVMTQNATIASTTSEINQAKLKLIGLQQEFEILDFPNHFSEAKFHVKSLLTNALEIVTQKLLYNRKNYLKEELFN